MTKLAPPLAGCAGCAAVCLLFALIVGVIALTEQEKGTPPANVILPDDQRNFENYLTYAEDERNRLLDNAKNMTSIQAEPILKKVASLEHPSPPKNMENWSCYVWNDIKDVGDYVQVDCKGKGKDSYYRLQVPSTFRDKLSNVNKDDWVTFSGGLDSVLYGENQIPMVSNDEFVIGVSTIKKSE